MQRRVNQEKWYLQHRDWGSSSPPPEWTWFHPRWVWGCAWPGMVSRWFRRSCAFARARRKSLGHRWLRDPTSPFAPDCNSLEPAQSSPLGKGTNQISPGKVMWTPLLGEQISFTWGLSIFLMLSVNGPVALITHLVGIDQVFPKTPTFSPGPRQTLGYLPVISSRQLTAQILPCSLVKLVTFTWLATVAPNRAAVSAMERFILASSCCPTKTPIFYSFYELPNVCH